MQKFIIVLSSLLAISFFALYARLTHASIPGRVTGRILLQVQEHGEAWYINPQDLKRYYMGRPADAFNLMQSFALGITNANLAKIPEAGSTATGDLSLRQRLSGRILLQVQSRGEAWYVNPVDLKRYYLGRPADAFQIMRKLGLGITNRDLNTIPGVTPAQRIPATPVIAPPIPSTPPPTPTSIPAPTLESIPATTPAPTIPPSPPSSIQPTPPLDQVVLTLPGCQYNNPACATDYECINNQCVLKPGCLYNNPPCQTNENCSNNVCVRKAGCQYNNPSCRSGETCIDNTCKPAWKVKLDQLLFPGYQKTIDVEGHLIISSGRYKVAVPDANAEDYAKFRLYQLKVCSEKIEQTLGSPPYKGNQIVDRTVVGAPGISYCCGEAPEYAIVNKTSRSNFEQLAFGANAYWKNSNVDFDSCLGGHEEVHRFVLDSLLQSYGWANEGLAQLLEERFRGDPGTPASPSLISCSTNTFRAIAFDGSGEITVPFRTFTNVNPINAEPFIYSYYTWACFWDHIDRTYGRAAFQQILRNTYNLAGVSNDFYRDAVAPVAGEGIWSYLEAFGVRP